VQRFDAPGFEGWQQTHKNPEQPIKTTQINEARPALAYLRFKNKIGKIKTFNSILSNTNGCDN
jgi:hypothetical protein